MSKSKPLESNPSRLTRETARGLAAYQHTLKKESTEDASKAPEGGKTNISQNDGSMEFIKTHASSKPKPSIQLKKIAESAPKKISPEAEKDSKYRRVAKLLVLIGTDEAARILTHLDPEQVEAISKEVAAIRGVTAEEAESVLTEFRSLLSASYPYSASAAGGVDTAREILHTAFGAEKGEAVLNRTVPESTGNPFKFLEELSAEQLGLLFKDESPAAEALILSRLSPKLSAEIVANSPPSRKIELIRRIAYMEKTSPEILERVATAIKEKVRNLKGTLGMEATAGVNGMDALAAILKSTDPSFGERILQELGDDDPYMRADLKERLNTLDDVVKAEDRAIQDKLLTMSNLDIVLLLKSRSEAFVEKILSNISADRRASVREEAEILGPVRKRDVDKAAKSFLDWFRQNREAGHIILNDDEDIII